MPDDVAVVGFDDVREAELSRRHSQPIDQLGRTLTRVLLARIAGVPAPGRTVSPIELMRRVSA